jgi:predicted methyltransferase
MIRRSIGLGVISAGVAIILFAIPTQAQMSPMVMATVQESAPIPADQIPPNIKDAVASPDRPADDKSLDAGRKPDQILAFFGIAPGMQVAELFAGNGYSTELLARAVGPTGKVYSQNSIEGWQPYSPVPFPEKFRKSGEAWETRLKNPALNNVVPVKKAFSAPDLLPVAPGSLDAVIMNMNYHDMVLFKIDRDKVNAAVFKALKPGGFYDIVDHSAKDGSGIKDVSLHRIDEKSLIADIQKAGFKLAAASSALRHPGDDRTWMVFKQRGQTDRFMLKFVKPQ